jgi:arabinofuranosyltransferase
MVKMRRSHGINSSDIRLTWAAIIIALIVLVAYNIYIHPWMIDDAFISFRYAENLASGNGPVFNVGEKVEGYTSFLWVAVLAMGARLGFDIVIFSKILGFLFAIGSLILLGHAHYFIDNIGVKTSVLAVLFTGTCGVFIPWASSGMEVNMFLFFTLFTILYHLKIRKRKQAAHGSFFLLGLVAGLTALVRPEGLILFALIFVDSIRLGLKTGDRRQFYFLLGFVILYIPYFIWRFSYYGYPLPNTFYNKVGMSIYQVLRGAKYTTKFVIAVLALLVPIFELLFHGKIFRKVEGLYFLLIFISVYTVYTTIVGGDVFPAYRFYAAIMPIVSLVAAIALVKLIESNGMLIRLAVLIVLFNLVQLRTNYDIHYRIKVLDTVAQEGKEVGLWFRDNMDRGATLAINSAGAVSYYSNLKVIDMLGLTDEHIAHMRIQNFGKGVSGHEKGDGIYVLSREPDIIQFGTTYGWEGPEYIGGEQIFARPEFRRDYTRKSVDLSSGKKLIYFVRKAGS